MNHLKEIVTMSKPDYNSEPLFFGKNGIGPQRYDQYKDKKIFQCYKNMLGFFWRPEEVSLGNTERNTFANLLPAEKDIYTKNLKFQILLDSVQSRGIPYLMKYCTNTEMEASMQWWMAFEQLHSYSYSYIISDVYTDPSKVFDSIYDDPEIVDRATSVTKQYNDLLDELPEDTEYDKKKKFYLAWVSVNILEGIRFYVSFACNYAFAETGKMIGTASIISLINRDENLHLGLTQHVLKLFKSDETEGFVQIAKDCEEIVIQMFSDAADEEIKWAKYLFEESSMIGLNAEILAEYMKHLTNKRMKTLGLGQLFPTVKKNPLPWMSSWTDSGAVQLAPQEMSVESYKIGAYKNNVADVDWSDKYSV